MSAAGGGGSANADNGGLDHDDHDDNGDCKLWWQGGSGAKVDERGKESEAEPSVEMRSILSSLSWLWSWFLSRFWSSITSSDHDYPDHPPKDHDHHDCGDDYKDDDDAQVIRQRISSDGRVAEEEGEESPEQ